MAKKNQTGKTGAENRGKSQLTVDQQYFTARYIGEEARWLQTIANRDKLQNLSKLLRQVVLETESMTGKFDLAEQKNVDNANGTPKIT